MENNSPEHKNPNPRGQKKLEKDMKQILAWLFEGKYNGPIIQIEYETR